MHSRQCHCCPAKLGGTLPGLGTSKQQARNGKQSKQELKSSGHFATRVVGAVCNWGCLGVSQVLSRISCPLPVVASRPAACKQGYALRASTRQTPRPREATLSSHAVAARPHARCPARTPRVVLLLWKRSGCGSVSAVQAIAALSTAHCIHHRQRADKRLDRQEQALHCAARTPHPADMQLAACTALHVPLQQHQSSPSTRGQQLQQEQYQLLNRPPAPRSQASSPGPSSGTRWQQLRTWQLTVPTM